ncbi:hypothetical protein GEMRC1_003832 [Eukaryota sp. GEM-RC1]
MSEAPDQVLKAVSLLQNHSLESSFVGSSLSTRDLASLFSSLLHTLKHVTPLLPLIHAVHNLYECCDHHLQILPSFSCLFSFLEHVFVTISADFTLLNTESVKCTLTKFEQVCSATTQQISKHHDQYDIFLNQLEVHINNMMNDDMFTLDFSATFPMNSTNDNGTQIPLLRLEQLDCRLISEVCQHFQKINLDISTVTPSFLDPLVSTVLPYIKSLQAIPLLSQGAYLVASIINLTRTAKFSRYQASALSARVLRLANIIWGPFARESSSSQLIAMKDSLCAFESCCTTILTVLKRYSSASWLKRNLFSSSFNEDFKACHQELNDLLLEINTGFTANACASLQKVSSQQIESITSMDRDSARDWLQDLEGQLDLKLRSVSIENQQQSEQSFRNIIQEELSNLTLSRELLNDDSPQMTPLVISESELELDWSETIMGGQGFVVFGEYGLVSVAVKFFKGDVDDLFPVALNKEFNIISSIRKIIDLPGLPRYFGVCKVIKRKLAYFGIVMERLSEETLTDRVSSMKDNQKLRTLLEIGNTLCICHENFVIHRDLKPENILFRDKAPVIIDWGAGKDVASSNTSVSLLHNRIITPRFASPEQVKDVAIHSASTDVFSFALICVYVFSGQSLWSHLDSRSSRDALIIQALDEGNIPPLPSTIPCSLVRTLQSCLTIQPLERPSMADVVSVLQAQLDNKPVFNYLNPFNSSLGTYAIDLLSEADLTLFSEDELTDMCEALLNFVQFSFVEELKNTCYDLLEQLVEMNGLSRFKERYLVLRHFNTAASDVPVFTLPEDPNPSIEEIPVVPLEPVQIQPFSSELVPSFATLTQQQSPGTPISVPIDPTLQHILKTRFKLTENLPITEQALASLHHLNLRHVCVRDISPLQYCCNLKELNAQFTRVSNLVPISALNLEILYLSNNSDIVDISPLKGLTSLKVLCLSNTRVANISPLQNLSNLTELSLVNTRITSVQSLTNLGSLQRLNISKTKVKDLFPLLSLHKLSELIIESCSVSSWHRLRFKSKHSSNDLCVNY